jgi:hypothetical protein
VTVETFQHHSNGVEAFRPAAAVATQGIERIAQWAMTVRTAAEAVELIIDTPFIPAVFWPKYDPRDEAAGRRARQVAVASATAAILYGDELGIGAMNSLTMVHVVKGKPGLYAEAMVALLRSHGHEVAVEDLTDTRCRVWGRRAGTDTVHRAEFSIERAKRAGYVGQNAKYGTDPQSMLYARAVSILCRQMAPEVLKGLGSVEEATDEPDGTAPKAATRTVQRAAQRPELAAPAPAVQPATVAPVTVPAPSGPPLPGEEDEPEKITELRWRAINDSFRSLGVTGTGQAALRMKVVCHIIDRQIARGSEMTAAEGLQVDNILRAEEAATYVAEILFPEGAEPAATPEQAAWAPLTQHLGDVAEVADAAGEDFDPTTSADWQGGDMAGEGQ